VVGIWMGDHMGSYVLMAFVIRFEYLTSRSRKISQISLELSNIERGWYPDEGVNHISLKLSDIERGWYPDG
jgi:hypothetical protein